MNTVICIPEVNGPHPYPRFDKLPDMFQGFHFKMHISDALIQVPKIQNSLMRIIRLHGGEDARDKGISLQFSRGDNMLKQ